MGVASPQPWRAWWCDWCDALISHIPDALSSFPDPDISDRDTLTTHLRPPTGPPPD